jgi:Leucine-rich repeat (LRR) protein
MPYQELGVALWFFIPALALAAIAYLWLIVKAFGVHVGWGIAVLLFAPAALLFVAVNWKAGRAPAALFLFACVLFAGGFVAGQFVTTHDPRVKMVEGEKHITLTRAKADYADVLKKNPDVVVLQMAECDVNDETLAALAELSQLRELDLNNNPITDEGLAHLAKLPKLEILRLNFTQITDEGFKKHLFDVPQLKEINVRQTKVASSTARAWVKEGKKHNVERKQTSGK